MDQQKEQPKQDYGKYDPAQGYAPPPQPNFAPPANYAPPQQGYPPMPPPPQYGQVQQYPPQYQQPQFGPSMYPYRRRNPALGLVFVALILLGLMASLIFGGVGGSGKDFNQSVSVVSGATLHINANSVDVKLTTDGGKDGSVSFAANKVGTFELSGSGKDVNLKVESPGMFSGFDSRLEVTLPADMAIDLNTGSGDVTFDKGGSESGQVQISTGSGNINANGIRGNLEIRSGSGEIKVDGAKVVDSLKLHTGSGDIDYKGDIAKKDNAVDTGSGEITLRVPDNSQFHFDLDTGSGDITNDFGPSDGKRVSGTTVTDFPNLPQLTVKSGSGDINILKGN